MFSLRLCDSAEVACCMGSVSAVWKCMDYYASPELDLSAVTPERWDLKAVDLGVGHLFEPAGLLGWGFSEPPLAPSSESAALDFGALRRFHTTILSDLVPNGLRPHEWFGDEEDVDRAVADLCKDHPRRSPKDVAFPININNFACLPVNHAGMPPDLARFVRTGVRFAGSWHLTGFQMSSEDGVLRMSRATLGDDGDPRLGAGVFHLTLRVKPPKAEQLCCVISHMCVYLPRCEWMRFV
ncbi:protein ORF110 [Cyprinid herpesvirus 3]|uniref:ORF110R n=1 Tax=Cyprinid herpesvirus 3 TaxID=180230 RepID=A3QMS8_CYHV3|nr:unnamed protein product [Cyprinid herpesvirus 3]ABC55135.1 hypothetical protein [Cyprinid herpesvirus 3]ABG42937.1 protein ORF110 [Cyprinid herpesvirus 3]AIC32465.1 ORF110R [Cyprinid herpesvirus 3]AJP55598.1 protein ORF110 [Cyprinid herpesvirus 3]AJP55753.1 protein ORF110 [Cyprinid herpesvirus 3]